MESDQFALLAAGTGVASALVAGIFYAFSSFVMGALARIAPDRGIAAMQSINIVVLNPWFFAAFFGTGLLALGVLFLGIAGSMRGSVLLPGLGAMLYLVGTIGVTVIANVPMNKALGRLSAEDAGSVEYWAHYCRRWTFWNHVRTAAALGASGMLISAAI